MLLYLQSLREETQTVPEARLSEVFDEVESQLDVLEAQVLVWRSLVPLVDIHEA